MGWRVRPPARRGIRGSFLHPTRPDHGHHGLRRPPTHPPALPTRPVPHRRVLFTSASALWDSALSEGLRWRAEGAACADGGEEGEEGEEEAAAAADEELPVGGAVKARFQGGELWRAGTVAEHNEDGTLDVLRGGPSESDPASWHCWPGLPAWPRRQAPGCAAHLGRAAEPRCVAWGPEAGCGAAVTPVPSRRLRGR